MNIMMLLGSEYYNNEAECNEIPNENKGSFSGFTLS